MSAALTSKETACVNRLAASGLSHAASAIAVVLMSRKHARPQIELVDILRQYQGLEDPITTEQGIQELRQLGWLVDKLYDDVLMAEASSNLGSEAARRVGDPSFAFELEALHFSLQPYISYLGEMTPDVYTSYLKILANATSEVSLPMLATTPNIASVDVLQERAKHGVKVRVLLGSPELTAQLRGAHMTQTAKDAIAGWVGHAKGLKTFDVRVTDRLEDARLATSFLVDDRLLRLDAYDPVNQRSLDGILLQFDSPTGMTLNIIGVFRDLFNSAWQDAQPVEIVPKLLWHLSRSALWLVFLGVALATFLIRDSFFESVVNSAAASFLVAVGTGVSLKS